MIQNKKTLSIADCGIQIVCEKEEGADFALMQMQRIGPDGGEIEEKIEFFIDKATAKSIRDFFVKVKNEWV